VFPIGELLRMLSVLRDGMTQFSQFGAIGKSSVVSVTKNQLWKIAILCVLVFWLYAAILVRLAEQWWTDPNFSHGFLVPAFAVFVLWRERTRLANLPNATSVWGLPVIVIALLTLVTGVLGAELFLSRVSLLLLLAGLVLFFRGRQFFRAVLFPWACLFLMVPIPAILFNHITFPLQMFASQIAAIGLPQLGVPVLREGNIIILPSMPLEVAEACSGIRSLLSLLTLAVIYGYFAETRVWIRIALAAIAVPIAVAANSLRVVGTGILAQNWGPGAAEGFFHSFSGWLIFIISLGGLALLHSWFRLSLGDKKAVRNAA
jgi:exosortase